MTTLAGRLGRPARLAVRRAVALGRARGSRVAPPRRRASRTPLLQAIGEIESAPRRPRAGSSGDLPQLVDALSRASSHGSASAIVTALRRHAVERLRGDLDAWVGCAGLRVRVRGSDRRGVGAARGARRAHGGDGVDPVRAGRGRLRGARRGRSEDLAGLAGGAIEELPHRQPAGTTPAALALRSSASCSPTSGGRTTALDGAIRFLEGAGTRGHGRAPRERGRRAACAAGPRPSAVARRLRVRRSLARAARGAFAQLAVPLRGRACATPRRDTPLGRRARLACSATSGSRGSRGDLFRVPPLAVLGLERRSVDFLEGRLRGRAVADRRGSRRVGEPPRRARCRSLSSTRRRTTVLAAARGFVAPADAERLGPRVASDHRRRAARRACVRAAELALGELEALARSRHRGHDGRCSSQRSSARALPPEVRHEDASRCSTTSARTPMRSTSCSCSGWRRARSRAVRDRRRSERRARRRARRPARATGSASHATAISSTRRARARHSGSSSCARRPATRVFRASRARSGRTSDRSSTTPTCSARPGDDRSRL